MWIETNDLKLSGISEFTVSEGQITESEITWLNDFFVREDKITGVYSGMEIAKLKVTTMMVKE